VGIRVHIYTVTCAADGVERVLWLAILQVLRCAAGRGNPGIAHPPKERLEAQHLLLCAHKGGLVLEQEGDGFVHLLLPHRADADAEQPHADPLVAEFGLCLRDALLYTRSCIAPSTSPNGWPWFIEWSKFPHTRSKHTRRGIPLPPLSFFLPTILPQVDDCT